MAGTLNLFAYVGDVMGVMGRGRRDKRNGLTGMRDHLHMSTSAIALEPRFMFDAAGTATAVDAVTHDPATDAHFDTTDHAVDQKLLDAAAQTTESGTIPISAAQATDSEAARNSVSDTEPQPASETPIADVTTTAAPETAQSTRQPIAFDGIALESGRQEIVFIDTGVDGWEALRGAVEPGVEVILLDPTLDGVTQISEALRGRSGIDAIHVLSHGGKGVVELGTTILSETNIDQFANSLADWGTALSEQGDILLYGCSIGESSEGLSFITKVAELTGADVAASDDITASPNVGGDFDLEVSSGIVDATGIVNVDLTSSFSGSLTLTLPSTEEFGATAYDVSPAVSPATNGSYINIGGTGWDASFTGKTRFAIGSAATISSSGSDMVLLANTQSTAGNFFSQFIIKTTDGGNFKLNSLAMNVTSNAINQQITITGYRDGGATAVGTKLQTNSTSAVANVTFDSTFQNIDELRFTFASNIQNTASWAIDTSGPCSSAVAT
jgi:hypothetical protein